VESRITLLSAEPEQINEDGLNILRCGISRTFRNRIFPTEEH
jgi:hypothetical protein